MPTLWRISNYEDLQGLGGLYTAGRWHPLGQRVVYLSEHPVLALLEVMVHLEIDQKICPIALSFSKSAYLTRMIYIQRYSIIERLAGQRARHSATGSDVDNQRGQPAAARTQRDLA